MSRINVWYRLGNRLAESSLRTLRANVPLESREYVNLEWFVFKVLLREHSSSRCILKVIQVAHFLKFIHQSIPGQLTNRRAAARLGWIINFPGDYIGQWGHVLRLIKCKDCFYFNYIRRKTKRQIAERTVDWQGHFRLGVGLELKKVKGEVHVILCVYLRRRLAN